MVVWLSETPMHPERTYVLRHTTRTTKAAIERVEYRIDVNTLSRIAPAPLGLNEIGRVVLRTTQKLLLDAYARNRGTGSVILVDPVSNNTVAAGMVIDRVPEERLRPPLAAAPRSEHVRREAGLVSVADRERQLAQRAVTIWLTGLSGSGKSTIAKEAERRLHAAGRHVYVLDGDNLRLGLNRDLAFSAGDRTENIRRAAEVARLFNDAGTIVLVPVISPFRADREAARRVVGEDRFFEVHVSAPIEVCEARDAKGLYGKARAGEIEEFTGVSSPYEAPERAALVLDTAARSVDECVTDLLARIAPAIAPPPA
jgi:bifunctional enzyme CysN/CysC